MTITVTNTKTSDRFKSIYIPDISDMPGEFRYKDTGEHITLSEPTIDYSGKTIKVSPNQTGISGNVTLVSYIPIGKYEMVKQDDTYIIEYDL